MSKATWVFRLIDLFVSEKKGPTNFSRFDQGKTRSGFCGDWFKDSERDFLRVLIVRHCVCENLISEEGLGYWSLQRTHFYINPDHGFFIRISGTIVVVQRLSFLFFSFSPRLSNFWFLISGARCFVLMNLIRKEGFSIFLG